MAERLAETSDSLCHRHLDKRTFEAGPFSPPASSPGSSDPIVARRKLGIGLSEREGRLFLQPRPMCFAARRFEGEQQVQNATLKPYIV